MKVLKKIVFLLAALSGFFIAQNAYATCSNYTSYSDGQVLTGASLNSLQTNYTNCVNGVLDGDTFTGNLLLYSGSDILFYSDTGSTLKAAIYGDSGKILGYPQNVGVYNLELVRATTTNTGDSLKVQCGGAACSATNPGFVVMNGTTAGTLTTFTVTADVTQLLTGATWGIGGSGDITGALIRALFVNDNGTLRTCFAYLGGRDTVLTTDTNATNASVDLPEEVLCNTAVASSTNTVLDWGYARADFDDTGGAAEDLWAVESGINDVVTGKTADGLYQRYNQVVTGFSANPNYPAANQLFSQDGQMVTIVSYSSANGTSNATTFTLQAPSKVRTALISPTAVTTNNSAQEGAGYVVTTADSRTLDIARPNGTAWTSSGSKGSEFVLTYPVGPAASFIQ